MKALQPNLSRARKFRLPIHSFWVLAVFLVLASPYSERMKFLSHLEDVALSILFTTRADVEPSAEEPPIVLVGIDEPSLEADFSAEDLQKEPWLEEFIGGWPWPRSLQGELLRRILEDGAKTVAFDVEFPVRGEGDESFQRELAAAGNAVVLASKLSLHKTETGGFFYRESFPSESILPEDFPDSQIGFVNPFPDEDGVVRSITLKTDIPYESRNFQEDPETVERLEILSERTPDSPSFSLAAATSFAGALDPSFAPETGKSYLINFPGAQGWFPILSAKDFFLPDQRERLAPLVEGAVVIIAPVAERFKDKYETSFEMLWGAEIHAHALRNLLLGNFLHTPGAGGRSLWLAALSLLAAVAVSCCRGVALKAGFLSAIVAAWLVGVQLAFNLGDVVLPAATGLLLLLLTGGGLLLYDYLLEEIERRQVRRYLSDYVSPAVAKILLDEGGGFERLRRGEVRQVALLFSDIRGFTAASEERDPGELTAQLNEYFDEMVGPVFDTDGSLNKYIGDAVFAVWGDLYPRGEKTDARNTLEAALRMREALARLNREWEDRSDRMPFRIGIGLHQGPAFVGNVGHPARLEVAVMGDAVNLASRIESANKFYGTDILVSESLQRAAENPPGMIRVDKVLLSGSSKPIELYYPVDRMTESAEEIPSWISRWNRAVEEYRQRRFAEALRAFENLPQAPACLRDLYLGRCRENLHNPPSEDWSYLHRLGK